MPKKPLVIVEETPEPKSVPDPYLGEDVLYVLADGVTIRPAKVVSWYRQHTPIPKLCVNVQVFFDGSNDALARRPGAFTALQDWVTNVEYREPKTDEYGATYEAGTWHRRSVD